jgi:hypothetical protein
MPKGHFPHQNPIDSEPYIKQTCCFGFLLTLV